jgi:DNA-binding winged helix-turn-helix (wHTH) protein/TolB-like protein/Tfp pilus assembly protein PilF
MIQKTRCVYVFGSFRIEVSERQLLRDDQPVPLPPKVFDTLLVLVEHSGHIVGKDELMKTVWPDTFVEEANLTVNISALRKVLGEDSPEQQFIETIPRRGYRFIAPVSESQHGTVDLIAKEDTGTCIAAEEEHETSVPAESAPAFEQKARPVVSSGTKSKVQWRWQIALGLVCVLAIGSAVALSYFWSSREAKQRETSVAGKTALKSIAVLPFKTLGSQDDEYLGIGITDALITRLGNIRQIVVRPTSAVRKYTDAGQDSLAAGREQGVEVVLDGRLQRDGDRIRLTVQLLRVQDGVSLWAAKFDDRFTNIFAVEDSISQQVIRELPVELGNIDQARFQKHQQENIEAYESYLKGRYFWNKYTVEGNEKAIAYFNQAIANDSRYALAYVGLAESYGVGANYGWLPPKEAMPKAKAAATKALEIDDTLAEAHTSLGGVEMFYEWDWTAAERELKRALELNPNYPSAHDLYSNYLQATGRLDEAIAQSKRAEELDPLSLGLNEDTAIAYYISRQYDQAIEQYRKTLELDSGYVSGHLGLGHVYEQKGRYEEAIAEYQKAISLSERTTDALGALGHALAASGKRSEAMKVLDELKHPPKQRYASPYDLAILYVGLGEKEEALRWLEKAYEARASGLIYLKVDPIFDSLRSDPRFAALVQRVGLGQ